MKRSMVPGLLVLVSLLLLLLLMVLSGSTSCAAARPLRRETNDRADEALWIGTSDNKTREHRRATTLMSNEEASDFSSVRQDKGMGEMEDQEEEEEEKGGCESEEEECMRRRRRIAEAHLDYIYTQHNPHH